MTTEALPPLLSTTGSAALAPEASASGTGAGGDRAIAAGDFQTFLTLLTAQLRNQDPLQPIDSAEFVAQLASFSTVEQVIGSNERLDTLIATSTADDAAGLAAWLGAEAADREGRIVAGEDPVSLDIPAQEGADRAEIAILDAEGEERAVLVAVPGERTTVDPVAAGAGGPGEILRLVLRYRAGDTLLRETAATVFNPIVAVTADAEGPVLKRADGLELRPADVTALAQQR